MRWAVAAAVVGVALLIVLWSRADDTRTPVSPAARSSTQAARPAGELAAEAAATPAAGTLRLDGVVIDEDEHPVAGAKVSLPGFDREAASDADGAFAFDGLAAGHYTVLASTRDASGGVEIDLSDETEPLRVKMNRLATVTLHVVDADGGKPIAGASVTATEETKGLTDADGNYEVHGLPPGIQFEFRFEVEAAGYEISNAPVSVDDAPKARNITIVALHRGAPVAGLVVGPGGEPVAEATVTIEGAGTSHEARSDATGHWRLAALGAGTRRFSATTQTHIATDDLVVELDGTHPREDLVIRVQVGARIGGIVVDGAGDPVEGAQIYLETASGAPMSATSDASGHFAATGGRFGKYVAWARKAGAASPETVVELVPERTLALRLVVAPSAIEGIVVDPHGKPVAKVRISAYGSAFHSMGRNAGTTDANGRFAIAGLKPDTYRLYARRDGQAVSTDERPLQVKSGTHDVRIVVPDVASLSGSVVLDGKPVTSFALAVSAEARDPGTLRTIHSSTGQFAESGIPAGTWRVTIAGPDFARVQIEGVVIAADRGRDLGTIVVDRGRSLGGRVTDSAGAPVAGAMVMLHDRWSERTGNLGQGTVTAITDATGAYRLDHIATTLAAADHWQLEATHPTRGTSVAHPISGDEATLDLVLAMFGGIDGEIDGNRGRIRSVACHDHGVDRETSPDASGRFHLDDLPPGDYDLWTSPMQIRTPLVTVISGQRAHVVVHVPPVTIAVTVHVAGGRCSSVRLETEDHATSLWEFCLGADGDFADIVPGSYRACADRLPCMPIVVTPAPAHQTFELSTDSPR